MKFTALYIIEIWVLHRNLMKCTVMRPFISGSSAVTIPRFSYATVIVFVTAAFSKQLQTTDN